MLHKISNIKIKNEKDKKGNKEQKKRIKIVSPRIFKDMKKKEKKRNVFNNLIKIFVNRETRQKINLDLSN